MISYEKGKSSFCNSDVGQNGQTKQWPCRGSLIFCSLQGKCDEGCLVGFDLQPHCQRVLVYWLFPEWKLQLNIAKLLCHVSQMWKELPEERPEMIPTTQCKCFKHVNALGSFPPLLVPINLNTLKAALTKQDVDRNENPDVCTYPGILSHSSSVNFPSYSDEWFIRPAELELVWLLGFVRRHSFGLSNMSEALWR